MIEIKARYKIDSYYKKNNTWVLNNSSERVLNAHKKYWIDSHKYDFESFITPHYTKEEITKDLYKFLGYETQNKFYTENQKQVIKYYYEES